MAHKFEKVDALQGGTFEDLSEAYKADRAPLEAALAAARANLNKGGLTALQAEQAEAEALAGLKVLEAARESHQREVFEPAFLEYFGNRREEYHQALDQVDHDLVETFNRVAELCRLRVRLQIDFQVVHEQARSAEFHQSGRQGTGFAFSLPFGGKLQSGPENDMVQQTLERFSGKASAFWGSGEREASFESFIRRA